MPTKRAKKTLRLSNRTWFKLHGWCALPVWVLFSFICATGTLSVISHELTWLTNPQSRAANPANLPPKTAAQMVSKVEASYPGAKVTRVLGFEDYMVHFVFFTSKEKPFAIAYVNQYSGDIQYVNQGMTFIYFMRSLHGWLLFPWQHGYSIGYYLVSIMSIFMLGALITGLVVYKKFWRAYLQPKIRFNINSKQGRKALLSDVHKLIGVWSIWFLLIMSFTGLWYLAQSIIWHNGIDIDPEIPAINQQQLPQNVLRPAKPHYDLADALRLSKHIYQDFKVEEIMMPEHNRDSIKLYGKGDFIFYDHHAYYLAFNPWSGQMQYQRGPADMNFLQTMEHITDPLHFGNIGGIWTKIIWFIFGLFITFMPISGFIMWRKRNQYLFTKNTDSKTDETLLTTP